MKPLSEIVREARASRQRMGFKDSYYAVLKVAAEMYATQLRGGQK